MKDLKSRIERRTNTIWGVGHWANGSFGPAPWFNLTLRPKDKGWVRFEVSVAGRFFYLSWGHDR